MSLFSSKKSQFWDRWGIYFSGICVIHCGIAPVLLVFYPSLALFYQSKEILFHLLISIFIIPSFLFVVYSFIKVHKEIRPLIYLSLGFLFVLFSAFGAHEFFGHESEYLFSIAGSFLMIRGHFINHNHCNSCNTGKKCLGEKIFK